MSWLRTIGSGNFPALSGPSDPRGWSPLLLALFAAVLSAFLLPRQTPFPYRYEQGQPWLYRSLNAPFDYEVLYPEDQVKAATAKVEAEHGPYLINNAEVGRKSGRRFSELLAEQTLISRHDPQFADLVANPGTYEAYGHAMLDKIYSAGILAPETEDFLRDAPSRQVYVSSGNSIRKVSADQLFTLSRARDLLTDSLPFSNLRQPEMLLPILEKCLAPNLFYSDSMTLEALRAKRAAVLSTGLVVRKGETIIAHNELVTPEIEQKLDSLARRYEQPGGWAQLAGFALMAFLLFAAFFIWLKKDAPLIWQSREGLLLLPGLSLLVILLVNLTQQFAVAAPLILPLAALPWVLRARYGLSTGLALWALTALLTAFALDWGMGWLLIQTAAVSTGLLMPHARHWQGHAVGALINVAAASLAWLAACWAGRLPQALQTPDVLLFLALSAVLCSIATAVKWNADDLN